jgi:hypothetical protein
MSELKWDQVINIIEDLGDESFSYELSSDNKQLYLYVNEMLYAIMQQLKEGDITFHARACLPPDMAISTYASFARKGFTPRTALPFDVKKDGTVVNGIESLRYAADNIHLFWFGEDGAVTKKFIAMANDKNDNKILN